MGTKKFEGLERKAYQQIRNNIQTGDIFLLPAIIR